jgi:thymidylate synthase (FAD)
MIYLYSVEHLKDFTILLNNMELNKTTRVGNGGFITLVDYMGSDLSVVNAARVSFGKRSQLVDGKLSSQDKKLIKYLAEHKHWTPFAHTSLTWHIKAPIPIRTQFFKHKVGFVENEISRRYVSTEPEIMQPMWRSKPEGSVKQGSGDQLDTDKANNAHEVYNLACEHALAAYDYLIRAGICPEQARFVLPQGTYTEWYWTGNLSSCARFYLQRTDPHAQKEIQEYAQAMYDLIPDSMSVSWKHLIWGNSIVD